MYPMTDETFTSAARRLAHGALFALLSVCIGPCAGAAALGRPAEAEDFFRPRDPLARDLLAVFSMDEAQGGSLVYSRVPITATFTDAVKFVKEGSQRYAQFGSEGAIMLFDPPLRLGPAYTMAAWLKLPMAGKQAAIWQCPADSIAEFFDDDFGVWKKGRHTYCPCDSTLKGWHHIAVTCNGRRMTFYLDGAPKGSLAITVEPELRSVGNHVQNDLRERFCNAIDDMFIFNRDLTKAEIARLLQARAPAGLPHFESEPPRIASLPGSTAAPPAVPKVEEEAKPAPLMPADAAAPPDQILAAPLKAADIAKASRDSLAPIKGARGGGCGFLLKFGDARYVITTPRVAAAGRMAGLQTVEGSPLRCGDPSAAVGSDVFRVELQSGGRPMLPIRHVDGVVAVGDGVAVLGLDANAPGGIHAIEGKVVSIGADFVEVDAPFPAEDRGGPVVHLKTGKVMGVAESIPVRKIGVGAAEGADAGMRRVAHRFDSVGNWQSVNWIFFFAQATEAQNAEKLTDDLNALLVDLAKNRRPTPGLHTDPLLKPQIERWAAVGGGPASDHEFVAFLKTTCTGDLATAGKRLTYDCFKRMLAQQEQVRSELAIAFDRVMKVIGGAR